MVVSKLTFPLFAEHTKNREFFYVEFHSPSGIYNNLYVIQYAQKLGFETWIKSVDDEDLAEQTEVAEHYINSKCAKNIIFTCTENGDWIFAHRLHSFLKDN